MMQSLPVKLLTNFLIPNSKKQNDFRIEENGTMEAER